mgnify:FL=1
MMRILMVMMGVWLGGTSGVDGCARTHCDAGAVHAAAVDGRDGSLARGSDLVSGLGMERGEDSTAASNSPTH